MECPKSKNTIREKWERNSKMELNCESYSYLYRIEVALREFITEKLVSIYGSKWLKRGTSEEVREYYEEGIENEKKLKWLQVQEYSPLYYVEFRHLKEIMIAGDNWNKIFRDYFRKREDLRAFLEKAGGIRNKIAHCRKVYKRDIVFLKDIWQQLCKIIGQENIKRYIASPTVMPPIREIIMELKKNIEENYKLVKEIAKPVSIDMKIWERIVKSWWWNSEYLKICIDKIDAFFLKLKEFKELPRYKGCGLEIERWISRSDIDLIFKNCIEEIRKLRK